MFLLGGGCGQALKTISRCLVPDFSFFVLNCSAGKRVQFSPVQYGVQVLGKGLMRYTSSLNNVPDVAFEKILTIMCFAVPFSPPFKTMHHQALPLRVPLFSDDQWYNLLSFC